MVVIPVVIRMVVLAQWLLAIGCVRSQPQPATDSSLAATRPANPECQHDTKSFRCVEFINNYDADTITVRIPGVHPLLGENISVRVRGIDTAERRGKDECEKQAAMTAKEAVSGLLARAKRIDLVDVGRDKYFRILATVLVDGVSLADQLRKNNLAVAYSGGTKSRVNWCNHLGAPNLAPKPR
jgi:endonuclease YncB( thermonuclease family)